ncbi:hypothetical protein GCM10009753_69240 [Streptantibioticus ferralitis]
MEGAAGALQVALWALWESAVAYRTDRPNWVTHQGIPLSAAQMVWPLLLAVALQTLWKTAGTAGQQVFRPLLMSDIGPGRLWRTGTPPRPPSARMCRARTSASATRDGMNGFIGSMPVEHALLVGTPR